MRCLAEFAQAFRGVRGGSARLLVAVGVDPSNFDRSGADSISSATDLPPKIGFVIPKSVGNSVVRHRLCQQLRHFMRTRVQILRPGELVSVRVFPPAKGASSQDPAVDLDRYIASVRHKESFREGRREPLDESMERSIGGRGHNEVLPVGAPIDTGNSSESGERWVFSSDLFPGPSGPVSGGFLRAFRQDAATRRHVRNTCWNLREFTES